MLKKIGHIFGGIVMVLGGIFCISSFLSIFIVLFSNESDKGKIAFVLLFLTAFGGTLFWLGLQLRAFCSPRSAKQATPPFTADNSAYLDELSASLEEDSSDDVTPTQGPEIKKAAPAPSQKVAVDLAGQVFLMPIVYDGEPYVLPEPDYALHFWPKAGAMVQQGAKLLCSDGLPTAYAPATAPGPGPMHGRLLKHPQTQEEYLPLFFSYGAMVHTFGTNIHVSVISFEEAQQLCRECAGIVLGPGEVNLVLPGGSPERAGITR